MQVECRRSVGVLRAEARVSPHGPRMAESFDHPTENARMARRDEGGYCDPPPDKSTRVLPCSHSPGAIKGGARAGELAKYGGRGKPRAQGVSMVLQAAD